MRTRDWYVPVTVLAVTLGGLPLLVNGLFAGPSRGDPAPEPPSEQRPFSDGLVDVLPKDRIPAIFAPVFVPAARARIRTDAYVIGFAHAGEAHAYSLNLLDGHEIVNDTVGGAPVAVTWCPLCRTSIAYSRSIDGQTLTFGVSGKLWNNALVMYDRQTDTLWSHVTGEAIQGKLKGARLSMLAATPRITWGAWRKMHPRTLTLSVDGREDAPNDRYAAYQRDEERTGLFPIRRSDDRARAKELVVGVTVGRDSKAFPHRLFGDSGLLSDTVGTTRVIVYMDRKTGQTAVYVRPDKGEPRLDGSAIVCADARWEAASGKSLTGGPSLRALPHTNAYWFAWSAFYPRTELRAPQHGDLPAR